MLPLYQLIHTYLLLYLKFETFRNVFTQFSDIAKLFGPGASNHKGRP